MKLLIKAMTAATVVLLAFGVRAEGIDFQHISLDDALKQAKEQGKPLFIDVYATWCGPCKYLSNEVFVDDELGAYMNEHFINLKLDGEKTDGFDLMVDFNLDAYPTMLFLSAEKVELDRIVGAVSAETILETGKTVVDPTSSELFLMSERYDAGERDKEFLQAYISEMLDKDKDTDPVVDEYIELYPNLNLNEENELLIFCLGINDLDHTLTKEFLSDIDAYNAEFPQLTLAKMKMLIYGACEEARDTGDVAAIDAGLDVLYEPLTHILDEEITREELREAMMESLDE